MELYNVLLFLRCSAETAKINLMVFPIHIVLGSGAEINPRSREPSQAALYIRTHRKFHKRFRGKARSLKPGSCEEALSKEGLNGVNR